MLKEANLGKEGDEYRNVEVVIVVRSEGMCIEKRAGTCEEHLANRAEAVSLLHAMITRKCVSDHNTTANYLCSSERACRGLVVGCSYIDHPNKMKELSLAEFPRHGCGLHKFMIVVLDRPPQI